MSVRNNAVDLSDQSTCRRWHHLIVQLATSEIQRLFSSRLYTSRSSIGCRTIDRGGCVRFIRIEFEASINPETSHHFVGVVGIFGSPTSTKGGAWHASNPVHLYVRLARVPRAPTATPTLIQAAPVPSMSKRDRCRRLMRPVGVSCQNGCAGALPTQRERLPAPALKRRPVRQNS